MSVPLPTYERPCEKTHIVIIRIGSIHNSYIYNSLASTFWHWFHGVTLMSQSLSPPCKFKKHCSYYKAICKFNNHLNAQHSFYTQKPKSIFRKKYFTSAWRSQYLIVENISQSYHQIRFIIHSSDVKAVHDNKDLIWLALNTIITPREIPCSYNLRYCSITQAHFL